MQRMGYVMLEEQRPISTWLLLNLDFYKGERIKAMWYSILKMETFARCGWIICYKNGLEWVKGGGYIPALTKDRIPYRGGLPLVFCYNEKYGL